MSEYDFTVVTPSYNYGGYIGECLDSVLNQHGVSVEHIVVDAISTDNTAEVVASYSNVKFIQEPDDGMSDAINKGFRIAKGKWVMWLNADDRLKPGALAEVLKFSEMNPQADVLFGAFNFMDGEGKHIRKMPLFPFDVLMNSHYGPSVASTSCFLKNETVLRKEHLVDVDFKYVMDGEYYSRLGRLGMKFVYIPRYLADFRWHGGNLSLVNHSSGSDIKSILNKQKQYAETAAIRRAYGVTFTKDFNLCLICDGLLAMFFRLQRGLYKMYYGRLTKDIDAAK